MVEEIAASSNCKDEMKSLLNQLREAMKIGDGGNVMDLVTKIPYLKLEVENMFEVCTQFNFEKCKSGEVLYII